MIKTVKINESFSYIESDDLNISREICRTLTIIDESSKFKPKFRKYGMAEDKVEFFRLADGKIVVPNGLLPFIAKYGVHIPQEPPEFSPEYVKNYLMEIQKTLPFALYPHQVNAFLESINVKQQACISATGSGKSAVVSLICDFLMKEGKQGLVIVPSISLVTQIHKDFLDYGLHDLYNSCHLIGGENKEKHLNNKITISTWQSLMRIDKKELKQLDYILIDECHGIKVETKVLDIVLSASNAKYRIGLTGSLPEKPQDKMSIFSVVGAPKVYIRTSGLVKLGLATPVKINIIKLFYSTNDKREFKQLNTYPSQLGYIKEHANRNLLISKLSIQVAQKTGNTVIMCSHIQHMKDIYLTLMNERSKGVPIENKDIVGKGAFDFQKSHRIYFINGSTEAKQREKIKEILEIDDDAILVSNYALFSTGINIKKLANIVLASPLKSYTTITQSIGRAVRLHVSKETANIYDFVDLFSDRCVFAKQFEKRVTLSYEPEGFEIVERSVNVG